MPPPILVQVAREFDASPERVFDAWLNPDLNSDAGLPDGRPHRYPGLTPGTPTPGLKARPPDATPGGQPFRLRAKRFGGLAVASTKLEERSRSGGGQG